MTKGWCAEAVAEGLIALILCTAVGAMCCFMAGYSINSVIAPAAMVLAMAWTFGRSRSVKAVGLLLAIIAISLLTGWYCLDFSYDGNTYHKEIIYNLMRGWNLHDMSAIAAGYAADWSPWTMHYAKLPEVVAACIGKCFGCNIEIGKAFNFMLFAATALMVWSALGSRIPNRRARFWTVTAVMANPVLIAQIFSYYTDFCTYCYTVITLCAIMQLYDRRSGQPSAHHHLIAYLLIGVVTLLAIGTKFNAFFYQGLLLLLTLIWQLWHRDYHRAGRIAGAGAVALVAGVGLIFYHPYVTNMLWAGHPLYPLMGADAVDIMDYNTPDQYRNHGRIVNFLYNLVYPYLDPRYAIVNIEFRTGGFGAMLLPMLLIAIVGALRGRKRWPGAVMYAMVVTLLSCLCFDQAWWARYIPQLWLVPCLALMVMEQRHEQQWLRRPLVWLAVASLVASLPHIERVRRYHNNMTLERTMFSGTTVEVEKDNLLPGERYKLEDWGINYVMVDSVSPDRALWLFPHGSHIGVSPETYNAINEATGGSGRIWKYYPTYIIPTDIHTPSRQ